MLTSLSEKRVFISGEDGLLARSIIERLRSHDSFIVNDALTERTWETSYNWSPEIDVLDPLNVAAVKRLLPDIIIHTAAVTGTDKCDVNTETTFRCNVEATYNMALLAKQLGCYFVYFSTTAIYDTDGQRPFIELDTPKPRTLYGKTKWMGELISTALVGKWDCLVLRPCFIYGGARDTSSVAVKLIRNALGLRPPVVATLNPSNKKDFLYVDDFSKMVVDMVQMRVTGVYNLTRGEPRPYSDALKVLWSHDLKPQTTWLYDEDYLGHHVVDGKKAWRILGYTPSVSLEEGLPLSIKSVQTKEKERELTR